MALKKEQREEFHKKLYKATNYIVVNHSTIINTSKLFNLNRATLVRYLYNILPEENPSLYERFRKVTAVNKEDTIKRMSGVHLLIGDKKYNVLEEYIIDKLKDTDEVIINTSEFREILQTVKSNVGRYLRRLAQDKNTIIKFVKRDICGNCVFRIKDSLDEEVVPPLISEQPFVPRIKSVNSMVVEIHDFIVNEVKSSEEKIISIGRKKIAKEFNITVSKSKYYLQKVMTVPNCKLERKYQMQGSLKIPYYSLKGDKK